MTLETWSVYVATVLVLMCTPGPSQLLMLSNSIGNGFRRSLLTAAGDLSANLLQMLAAGLGVGALVLASGSVFAALQWAGVAYLLWLGVRTFRRAGTGGITPGAFASGRQLWWQGFVTSAANPKAILFFAALFPQFIDSELAFWPQFLLLSVTYLAMDAAFLALYGSSAALLAQRLSGVARRRLDRIAGLCLIGAALLLGSKTASRPV
ncbi:LysE family translocator [Marinobacter sp. JSM 1782161]|uniref:LysE family translocator n=1 Tax=Marinobacter sp. JSM 1782161 TaxID=2685906 RepID=UPI001402719A|nr:LysE family translocator [Marinobacter sp. JSM 1782161]